MTSPPINNSVDVDTYEPGEYPPIAIRCALARLLPADLLDECLEEELAIFYDEHILKSSGEIALRRGYTVPETLGDEITRTQEELIDPEAESVVHDGDITSVSAFVNRTDILAILKEQAELARQGSYVSLYDLAESKGFMPSQPEKDDSQEQFPHIDGYEFLQVIGRGGMGKVFKCRQLSMDRLVAIKILHHDRTKTPGFVQRFLKEARSVARLNHPNIISGIDCGQSGSDYYFVMEYFEGKAVSQLIRECGRLPETDALMITLQVARALEAAREEGIIHRDIKPGNMLINEKGIVKLTDLGLVKFVGGKLRDEDTLTSAMTTVGTPQYLSPEQAKGLPVDTRSDIYSLGISLFAMLAGRFPFEGSPLEIIVKHITEPMPSVKDFVEEVSEESCQLIRRMTAKQPEHRFQKPSEVERFIIRLLQQGGGEHAENLRNDQILEQARKEHTGAAPFGRGVDEDDEEGQDEDTASEILDVSDDKFSASQREEILFEENESDGPGATQTLNAADVPAVDDDDAKPSAADRSAVGRPAAEPAQPPEAADPFGSSDHGFSPDFEFAIEDGEGQPNLDQKEQDEDEELGPGIESEYVLVAVDGPLMGQSFPIREGVEATAGRDSELCEIVLNDSSVSRHHCAISCDVGRLLVIDLGSHNGTYINGEKIQTEHLYPGGIVQIGKNAFRLEIRAKE